MAAISRPTHGRDGSRPTRGRDGDSERRNHAKDTEQGLRFPDLDSELAAMTSLLDGGFVSFFFQNLAS
jgi:hypothetical protein